MLIDSHCHLNFPDLAGRIDEVKASMREKGVERAVVISVNVPDYPAVRALALAHEEFWATVGVHPDVEDGPDMDEDFLVAEAAHPKIIGIGETGLDYHWCKGDLEWQRERFRRHIRAARRAGVPLVIHTREAADDTLAVMREAGADAAGGVMHCFTENWDVARAALDLGFYLSFSGILTFKNARQVQEVAAKAPLDRILVETDSPYLAPVPYRGKQNEPAYTRFVAEYLATLRGLSYDEVAAMTTANFFRLFRKARP
ncbi:TatD family hydrolase [Laribacter hongkongensis]|uniref:Hydrolase, TatD family n=5 Tax=Laribacter hongkongensis TaxID=168471 RepID=C1DCQ7_LARHH|nr:TatD family hydrolase [Laribacter hongkongensis]ACO75676.1 Hydrolase, TatD family precursor [Laribacter hongkongensis HLHK9]MCG8993011.1 TatD family hydrolase [Laribacter hongkongensis]MCG8998757.1 TatD family hydrolase [Laribacter hongkongensis]MCG9002133.1 TatD family hydrolase [Laribacter hongkongensis]MCG9005282.1 TatD family hydrolase [Laribacter hongkongensis]